MDSQSVYRIEPLKGPENYLTWKIKMIDILTDLGLIDYADGSIPAPADTALVADWKKSDRKALSTIRLWVLDGPLVYIAGSKTSTEAWKALRGMYESRGPMGIVLVRRKFFRAQCEEGGNIEEHIRTMRSYQEELASLKQKVEEEDFSITLLTSLPESWNSFISSVDTADLKDSYKLISRILQEDIRLREKTSDSTMALAAHGKKKFNPKITCYGCGEIGHIRSNCPNGKKNSGKSWKGKGKGQTQAHVAKSDSDEEDYAFCVADVALTALSGASWIGDSGATRHSQE